MRLNPQYCPHWVQDPDDALIGTQQFDCTQEDLIKGVGEVALEPKPGGYLVQADQGGVLLTQLRLTLTALGEQCYENQRENSNHHHRRLNTMQTFRDGKYIA